VQFLDTNIFLRILTADDPIRTARCQLLFEQIERGEVAATTSEAIVTEIAYVLGSKRWYNLPPPRVADRMRRVLSLPNLRLPNLQVYFRALDIFEVTNGLDFEDAVAAAYVETQHLDGIYSYDRGLDRVPGVSRIEP